MGYRVISPGCLVEENDVMLNLLGEKYRLCDGLTRRDLLKVGALGFGGLSLPQLLAAEEQAGIRKSHKAIIMVCLV